jgi:hypothetical protein
MTKIEYRATQWAEMKPDVYAGDSCDQVEPRWEVSSEGDMGGSDTLETVELDARTFPPGTKITIEEPVCPQCGDLPEPIFPIPEGGPLYAGPCSCGFDWDAWTRDQYS